MLSLQLLHMPLRICKQNSEVVFSDSVLPTAKMPSYACCGVRKYGLTSLSTSAEGGQTIYSGLKWLDHIPEKKAGLESRGLSSSLLSHMSCGNSTEASWQTNIIVWKSITIWHVLWSRMKISWPTHMFYPLQKALTVMIIEAILRNFLCLFQSSQSSGHLSANVQRST